MEIWYIVLINGNMIHLQFNKNAKIDCKVESDGIRPPCYTAGTHKSHPYIPCMWPINV